MCADSENGEELSPETEMSDADFDTAPSTMPNCGVDLRAFFSKDAAELVGQAVGSYLYTLGKCFNLKRLHQVIVAFDYHEVLASLNRGVEGVDPLKATNDGIGVGIAMTPTILHEGEARAVIVVNAAYVEVLAEADVGSPEMTARIADIAYTLAHESAHVEDLDVRVTNLPGIILKTRLGYKDGILLRRASSFWDEYIASYRSARFGNAATLKAYEETLVQAVEQTRDISNAEIRQYRMHHDVGRATEAVSHAYGRLLVYASYLIGHVEGLDGSIQELAPLASAALEQHGYAKLFFFQLQKLLFAMHDHYGEWGGLEVYEPLKDLMYRVLVDGGIIIHDRLDGAGYVDIPVTPETTPTISEQREFLAARDAK